MLLRSLAFLIAMSSASAAADLNVVGSEIEIRGRIVERDGLTFKMISDTIGSDGVVVLRSDGGTVAAALQIGAIARLKGWKTIVPDDALCVSSCALIWVAGTPRVVGKGARIGFHSAYTLENGKMVVSGSANALVGAYLRDMGLSPKAIAFATESRPESLRWLTWPEAHAVGLEFTYGNDEPKLSDRLPADKSATVTSGVPEKTAPIPHLLRPVRKETKSELLRIFARDRAN